LSNEILFLTLSVGTDSGKVSSLLISIDVHPSWFICKLGLGHFYTVVPILDLWFLSSSVSELFSFIFFQWIHYSFFIHFAPSCLFLFSILCQPYNYIVHV
jgi:hypothetical protein